MCVPHITFPASKSNLTALHLVHVFQAHFSPWLSISMYLDNWTSLSPHNLGFSFSQIYLPLFASRWLMIVLLLPSPLLIGTTTYLGPPLWSYGVFVKDTLTIWKRKPMLFPPKINLSHINLTLVTCCFTHSLRHVPFWNKSPDIFINDIQSLFDATQSSLSHND